MSIDAERLKQLRDRKGWSRAVLAERSQISVRQITRIETGEAKGTKVRSLTISRLAKALNVESGVLTSDEPLPGATRPGGVGISRQVSAWIMPEVSLAYAVIKMRYGINLTSLVNMAPLLFVLLAEGSLVWRREKLQELKDALQPVDDLVVGYRRFVGGASAHVTEGVSLEEQSIENRDLFGETIAYSGAFDLGHDPDKHNPFADYLRELAERIGDPDIVKDGWIHDDGPLKELPAFLICAGDVDRFTGNSDRLKEALRLGLIRLNDMPDKLFADGAEDERIEWLEQAFEDLPAKARTFVETSLTFSV